MSELENPSQDISDAGTPVVAPSARAMTAAERAAAYRAMPVRDLPRGPRKPKPWLWPVVGVGIAALIVVGVLVGRAVRQRSREISSVMDVLHAQMVRGDDAAIFQGADAAWQEQVGVTKSNHLFDLIRTKMGAPHHYSFRGTNVSSSTKEGTITTVTFATKFDNGDATEIVRLHTTDNGYKLYGYEVDSPLLVGQ